MAKIATPKPLTSDSKCAASVIIARLYDILISIIVISDRLLRKGFNKLILAAVNEFHDLGERVETEQSRPVGNKTACDLHNHEEERQDKRCYELPLHLQ